MSKQYYEFEITLLGTDPRLWRRIQIKKSANFHDLHNAIQDVCGWEDSHLYSFEGLQRRNRIPIASDPREQSFGSDAGKTATKAKLADFFSHANACLYTYDFGDSWEHEVKLVKEFDSDEKFNRRLVGGEGVFPPEDCGGIPGYYDCLEAVTKKRGNKELREWLGDWDPKNFRLQEIQEEFNQ